MMKYKGFLGQVEYDDDAKIFHGEIIGLKYVITFQGKSVEELKKAFLDSDLQRLQIQILISRNKVFLDFA